MGPREWSDIGARVPDEMKRKMRPSARGKVEGVDRLLDIRAAGLTVMRLVEWCAMTGVGWRERIVTLRWRGEHVPGRVMWLFLAEGGGVRRGGLRAEGGPPTRYGDVVDGMMEGRRASEQDGPVTVGVKRAVMRLENIDARLRVIQKEVRGALRLYYDKTLDKWQIRQRMGVGATVYHGQQVPEAILRTETDADRGRIAEAVELLEQRRYLRRMLRVVVAIVTAAGRWPAGVWQIRGAQGKGEPAAWVATVAERGVMIRQYGQDEEPERE